MTNLPAGPSPHSERLLTRLWLALTGTLAGASIGFHFFSQTFARDVELTDRPALLLAAVLVAAGFFYLLTVPLITRSRTLGRVQHKTILWIILAGGLTMRLALMGSTPAFEDDWYRYLWDGGVTAHGFNPYAASPDDAQGEPYHYSLQPLAQHSGVVIERVNHPELTTVYPPVAQAAFALAHLISPWSLTAWRAVCLLAECATLLLLLALLKHLGRSRLWVALYWLSPLAAKEFINSAHMDVIVLPFVLAAALLSIKNRPLSAVTALSFAIGAKFWPLLLAPVIFRPLLSTPRRLAAAVGLLALLTLVFIAPMLTAATGETSGLAAYATYWRNNSAHYGLLESAFSLAMKPFDVSVRMPGQAVRILLGGLASVFAVWIARKPIGNAQDLLKRMGLVTAAVVLLSPSQFPWYAAWVLPFIVFTPWSGLLFMTAMISIYYAGFHYLARDTYATYREIIVFAIWLPVWALLAYEAWRVLIKGKPPLVCGAQMSEAQGGPDA
jgi:alpha-1,6-mannosyltransferase